MKPIFNLLLLVVTLIMLSCSEDDIFTRATTIKVVNLINGADNVIVKIENNLINYATTKAKVSFDDYRNFSFEASINRQLEIVKQSDTLNPIYSESLHLKGIHSLYLYGALENEEWLLIEDKPKQITDSLVGIRFINLSKTSGLVNINITGETATVVSGLNQEVETDYIEFPAKEVDGSYIFEFKDGSGNMLNSITVDPLQKFNVSSKKNLTLVMYDFGTSQKVARVNSY
ncbi:hypothetical protein Q4Q39_19165 [Flavivirga amylovorans]|uniref:DUF4397 domain-containing protein n=1 Tax=Flavivirga amylovorans TaxID=870486 RepID=A0ABT8X7I7_9FLAO|nr:hypothetical protein [Flavivirga amylovorans]MDO5989530.1 hypothetical protein [Flavivirga amylovorans]